MKFFHSTAVLLFFAMGFQAMAQVAKLPALKNPVLRRAPALASWTITFSYKDEESKLPMGSPTPGDRVRTIVVTKSGKMYWEQGTMVSGKKYDKWITDEGQFKTLPGSTGMALLPKPDEDHPQPDYSDYSRSDFPDLDWVSVENYRDTTTFEGKPAYLFGKNDSGGKEVQAILSDVQMPLSFSNKDSSRIYVFNPAPTSPLVIPEKIVKLLETHKKGLEVLQRHPSPP